MSHKCLYCESSVELADVNVATDVALCRACNKTMSFSSMVGSQELAQVDIMKPPKYVKFNDEFGGGTAITYKKISGGIYFLVPFTCVWSGLSMAGIYGKQIMEGKFDWGESLFGLPFLIGTIVLISVIFYMLLGRTVIRLANGVGTVFMGIGPIGWTRHFTYDRSTSVMLADCGISQNKRPLPAITIDNNGAKTQFGSFMQEESKLYVAALLRQAFKRS